MKGERLDEKPSPFPSLNTESMLIDTCGDTPELTRRAPIDMASPPVKLDTALVWPATDPLRTR